MYNESAILYDYMMRAAGWVYIECGVRCVRRTYDGDAVGVLAVHVAVDGHDDYVVGSDLDPVAVLEAALHHLPTRARCSQQHPTTQHTHAACHTRASQTPTQHPLPTPIPHSHTISILYPHSPPVPHSHPPLSVRTIPTTIPPPAPPAPISHPHPPYMLPDPHPHRTPTRTPTPYSCIPILSPTPIPHIHPPPPLPTPISHPHAPLPSPTLIPSPPSNFTENWQNKKFEFCSILLQYLAKINAEIWSLCQFGWINLDASGNPDEVTHSNL